MAAVVVLTFFGFAVGTTVIELLRLLQALR